MRVPNISIGIILSGWQRASLLFRVKWFTINQAQPRVLVLDCSAIPDIEYTALKQLTDFEEKLRDNGITLWLAALNPEPLRVIRRAELGEKLGRERMFYNLEQAFEAYQRQEYLETFES